MLQQPAQDAQIVFANGNLSIHADNSSLIAILHQVASNSGMKISRSRKPVATNRTLATNVTSS